MTVSGLTAQKGKVDTIFQSGFNVVNINLFIPFIDETPPSMSIDLQRFSFTKTPRALLRDVGSTPTTKKMKHSEFISKTLAGDRVIKLLKKRVTFSTL